MKEAEGEDIFLNNIKVTDQDTGPRRFLTHLNYSPAMDLVLIKALIILKNLRNLWKFLKDWIVVRVTGMQNSLDWTLMI